MAWDIRLYTPDHNNKNMKSKDTNKGGASPKNNGGINLGDLLSPATQALLRRTRDGLPEGWGELFCLPGEIVMSVVADASGMVYVINGLIAFSGGDDPQIIQAGFRSPVSGQWLDAMPRARTKWLSLKKCPAALMALPIDNVDLVPANAPEGTKETSLKIRWIADGTVLIYSLDRQRFSREQPYFHRSMKGDPMMEWVETALATLGEEMLMLATATYKGYVQSLEPGFNTPAVAAATVVEEPVAVRAPAAEVEGADPWGAPTGLQVEALTLEDFAGSDGIEEEELEELASEAVPGEVHDLDLKPLALSVPGAENKFEGLPEAPSEEDAWAGVEPVGASADH